MRMLKRKRRSIIQLAEQPPKLATTHLPVVLVAGNGWQWRQLCVFNLHCGNCSCGCGYDCATHDSTLKLITGQTLDLTAAAAKKFLPTIISKAQHIAHSRKKHWSRCSGHSTWSVSVLSAKMRKTCVYVCGWWWKMNCTSLVSRAPLPISNSIIQCWPLSGRLATWS